MPQHLRERPPGQPLPPFIQMRQQQPEELTHVILGHRESHSRAKGFLRVPFPLAGRTRHGYDNATTYVLARMVERVTGRDLPDLLNESLFRPMGYRPRRMGPRGRRRRAFGFHGLHLTTEAIAAFGELPLREGVALAGECRHRLVDASIAVVTRTAHAEQGEVLDEVGGPQRGQRLGRYPRAQDQARLERSGGVDPHRGHAVHLGAVHRRPRATASGHATSSR
jgi:CubicO group peptidase (beta-lactamase class C family)